MTAGAAPRLIGRDREIQALTDLLGKGTQAGQALVVIGDPGIGKSALLGAAQDTARAAGFRVLSAVGVESEAQLPFAGLHQILRPVLRSASELAPVYATALRSAFGLADGPTPELFQIALAAEKLLAAVAAKQPVAVLVDDVQWLDQQSQDILTFIARRAGPYPMVIVGAMRTGHPGPFLAAGLPELVVHGVDESAADDILRLVAGVLKSADRLHIRPEAQGNPLALLELPVAWGGSAPSPADWQPTLSARLGRERHEEPVGCGLLVGEAERAEQRRAMPGREPVRPVQDGTQQSVQRGEPQMRLLLGAADGQHDEPSTIGLIGSRPEQGGLAHPRIADDGECVPAHG
jgi:hypothetical protein